MPKERSGKTRSEISRDWQDRVSAKGLISVRTWVPQSSRDDLLAYAAKLRGEKGLLLSYEEKRQAAESASDAMDPAQPKPPAQPKKLSRKQRKAEKAKQARLPLVRNAGMLPGLP